MLESLSHLVQLIGPKFELSPRLVQPLGPADGRGRCRVLEKLGCFPAYRAGIIHNELTELKSCGSVQKASTSLH